ncbi:MAG: hypothetical protein E7774_01130 [Bradyrhizobium sp.]|nr:MAG: hypothetical protein E7774_01130 [Bradyrhizobium sp.]
MLNPDFLRGALSRATLVASVATFASCVGLNAVHAADANCGPLDATQALVVTLGGHSLAEVGAGRAATLRMILAPESRAEQVDVLTDRVLVSDMDDGRMAIVFAAGDRACGLVLLPEGTGAMLDALERVGRLPSAEML